MTRDGIICGGCWLVDKTKIVDHWPKEETVARILESTSYGGGPAMNIAVNLKRLGGKFPVVAVGAIGDDAEGAYLLDVCKRHDIDNTNLVTMVGTTTSFTDVMTSMETGKRTFFHAQGAGALLTPDSFDFTELPPTRIFHLGAPGIHDGLDVPRGDHANGWAATLKTAQKAGYQTNMELISLLPERLAELALPCLEHLDTIIINDVEVGALAGMTTVIDGVTQLEMVEQAARKVLSMGVKRMASVHFPGGCMVARPGEPVLAWPSVKVPAEEIISAVGAGDAFAAGLMFGYLDGWPIENSVALANGAAAACLCSLSTNEAIGTVEECLSLAERWGWREKILGAIED